jgi:hypothetical protein
VKAGLKWKIPPVLIKDLVAYVVTRINSDRSAAINLNVAPKVLFTGMRMDFKKEFCLAFGDYCEVYDGTDNTAKARSIPCVALYPCNNATGLWAFWNLNSMQRIHRTQWTKIVTTEELVARVNALEGAQESAAAGISATPTVTDKQADLESPVIADSEDKEQAPVEDTALGVENVEGDTDECPPLEDQGEDDSDEEIEEESEAESDDEEETAETAPTAETRHSARIGAGIKKPERFAMATEGIAASERAKKTRAAGVAEIKQVFDELQAIEPVDKKDFPKGVKALGSHLFTVEKFMADGQHDKFKSRLVSHETSKIVHCIRTGPRLRRLYIRL